MAVGAYIPVSTTNGSTFSHSHTGLVLLLHLQDLFALPSSLCCMYVIIDPFCFLHQNVKKCLFTLVFARSVELIEDLAG